MQQSDTADAPVFKMDVGDVSVFFRCLKSYRKKIRFILKNPSNFYILER